MRIRQVRVPPSKCSSFYITRLLGTCNPLSPYKLMCPPPCASQSAEPKVCRKHHPFRFAPHALHLPSILHIFLLP